MKSAKAAGLIISNHSDFPVTPIDPMFMLWSSMTRVSPTGVVSGPGERIDAYAAIQALTTGPAWPAFEADRNSRIQRSEAHRVGEECGRTCRYRGAQTPQMHISQKIDKR